MFEVDDVANEVIRFVGASLALQATGAGAKNVVKKVPATEILDDVSVTICHLVRVRSILVDLQVSCGRGRGRGRGRVDDSLALVDTPRTTRTTTEDGVDGSIGVFASRAGVRVSARVVLVVVVVLVGVCVRVRVLPRLRRRRGRWLCAV